MRLNSLNVPGIIIFTYLPLLVNNRKNAVISHGTERCVSKIRTSSATTSLRMKRLLKERTSSEQGCHPLTPPPFSAQTLRSRERGAEHWPAPKPSPQERARATCTARRQEGGASADVISLIGQQLHVRLPDTRPGPGAHAVFSDPHRGL